MPLLNLTHHQFTLLKLIREKTVKMSYLRLCHGSILGSLAKRGYLRHIGGIDDGQVLLTAEGEAAYLQYMRGEVKERRHEGDLTENCVRLLNLARTVARR